MSMNLKRIDENQEKCFTIPERATLYEIRTKSKESEFYPITPSEGIALEDSELYLYSSLFDPRSHNLVVERTAKSFDKSYSDNIVGFKSDGNYNMIITKKGKKYFLLVYLNELRVGFVEASSKDCFLFPSSSFKSVYVIYPSIEDSSGKIFLKVKLVGEGNQRIHE